MMVNFGCTIVVQERIFLGSPLDDAVVIGSTTYYLAWCMCMMSLLFRDDLIILQPIIITEITNKNSTDSVTEVYYTRVCAQ